MRPFCLIVLCLCCLVAPALAVEITAVVPSTVAPGTSVTLTGGPFAAGATVLVGPRRIAAEAITPGRMTFLVPALPSGEYALAVEQAGATSARNFTLRVVMPPPRIARVSPATLDTCAENGSRRITVEGSNFLTGANLLLDNTAVPIESLAATAISFSLPLVKPGMHQLQIVNPDNQRSLPHGLFLDSTPQIAAVSTAEERTIDYDLLVSGKNFLPDSTLIVNGVAAGKNFTTDSRLANTGGGITAPRDLFRFIDCSTLLYTRRPFIREPRELSLQVVNPGGEVSNVYQITTP